MKLKLALLTGIGLAISALAAELQQTEIQATKESPQSIVVASDQGAVAEIKLLKPGTLHIQGQSVSALVRPGGKKAYLWKGGGSLDLTVDGKSVLKVSGDSLRIEE